MATALVTGATAGLGLEFAWQLATARHDLVLVARATERPVGLLVNNAGMALHQRFVGGDLAREEAAFDVMVRAVMVLSHAAAGAMTARRRGAILNVGSVAALLASGTYAAHKAWVRSFTEGLAVELAGTGVTATVLSPGFVHTEFHQRASIDMSGLPEVAWLSADAVVAAALADVRRGVVISTPSVRYRVISGVVRALPRGVVRAIGSHRPSASVG